MDILITPSIRDELLDFILNNHNPTVVLLGLFPYFMKLSNTNYRSILVVLFILALTGISNVFAQSEPHFLAMVGEKKVKKDRKPTTPEKKSAYYFRHFKQLAPTYQGLLIELTVADVPLRRDHPLFNYFGNIHYKKFKNGKVAYYIIGDQFNSKKNAKAFVKNVVRPNAPDAKLVNMKRK